MRWTVMHGRRRIGHCELARLGWWRAYLDDGTPIGGAPTRRDAAALVRAAASARGTAQDARNGEDGRQDPSTAKRPALRLLRGGTE